MIPALDIQVTGASNVGQLRPVIVELGYRKVFHADSPDGWERDLFADTYQEFCMQAQFYDPEGKWPDWHGLLRQFPRAEKLHGLVSMAAIGYLRARHQWIPDILNAMDKPCLTFQQFQFEVLASHRQRKSEHRVAITFYSGAMIWLDQLVDTMLLAPTDQYDGWLNGEKIHPLVVRMRPGLFIHSIQKPINDQHHTSDPHPFG